MPEQLEAIIPKLSEDAHEVYIKVLKDFIERYKPSFDPFSFKPMPKRAYFNVNDFDFDARKHDVIAEELTRTGKMVCECVGFHDSNDIHFSITLYTY